MSIMISGGAGFIGSNLIRTLNEQEINDIIIVENIDSVNKMQNLVGLKFQTLVDYMDKTSIQYFLKNGCQLLIHLGAICDTQEKDVEKIMCCNYYYSRGLISTACIYKVPIIVASSAATYGNMKKCDDNIDLIKLRPSSPYAISKHLIDLYCQEIMFDKIVCLKFFNVYGDNEWVKPTNNQSFIYKSINSAIKNNAITLFDDIQSSRDFVHINDVCDAIIKSIELIECKKYGVYNVGTGITTDLKYIAEFIADEVSEYKFFKNKVFIDLKKPTQINTEYYQYYTKACISKAKGVGIECNSVLKEKIRNIIKKLIEK